MRTIDRGQILWRCILTGFKDKWEFAKIADDLELFAEFHKRERFGPIARRHRLAELYDEHKSGSSLRITAFKADGFGSINYYGRSKVYSDYEILKVHQIMLKDSIKLKREDLC